MSHHLLPELLCPAGDLSALKAAVDCGANAVYLGYKAFGARASAVNFDAETLSEAVSYAHLYHTRVHVTVNTLIKEKEFSAVRDALKTIRSCGADAVIVQDLGVAAVVRDGFPDLALHASTQMGLSNASDALFAKEFGFSRVVLARECSLDDIRKVVATGIETEVFAHGALCSGVSGRCLMSSMAGGRSGNRGRCAQPCRLQLCMGERKGALLSLKDLCTYEHLPAFVEAGVRSLKIEGRLKSPEYVAVVTSVYRKALDQIAKGSFDPQDPAPVQQLLQIFNRGGFTRGHAFGAEDADLCAVQRVSHEGIPLGTVTGCKGQLATVRLTEDLHDGDSLQLRGWQDSDMRYSGHDMPAGSEATLRLRPGLSAKTGTAVARLSDAKQLEEARAHAPALIPITMQGVFQQNQPMQLTLSDGLTRITVRGDPVQPAQKRAAIPEDACKQLEKLGGTPFVIRQRSDMEIVLDDGCFLPVSSLNELRRKAVEELILARIQAFDQLGRKETLKLREYRLVNHKAASANMAPIATPASQTLAVVFSDPEMGETLRQAGADMLIYEPLDLRPVVLRQNLNLLPEGCLVQLPPQTSQSSLESAVQCIAEHRNRLAGIVAGCVGQINAVEGLPVWAGPGVPVSNRHSLDTVCSFPVAGFHLWPEWSSEEQKQLLPFSKPALLKVYGREVLMLLNHCPERVAQQLTADRANCRICKEMNMACGSADAALTDQKGYRFPMQRVVLPEGCVLRVLGALPTDLRMYEADRLHLGAGMLLHFTTESRSQQAAVTRYFAGLRQGLAPEKTDGATAGHWRRGIE